VGFSSEAPAFAARAVLAGKDTRALDDPEPRVREHAAWALVQLASR